MLMISMGELRHAAGSDYGMMRQAFLADAAGDEASPPSKLPFRARRYYFRNKARAAAVTLSASIFSADARIRFSARRGACRHYHRTTTFMTAYVALMIDASDAICR